VAELDCLWTALERTISEAVRVKLNLQWVHQGIRDARIKVECLSRTLHAVSRASPRNLSIWLQLARS
jgi:hypothetical protein